MTRCPLGTRMLEIPSDPPPQGRVVSLLAVRVLKGTGGYTRIAVRSFVGVRVLGQTGGRIDIGGKTY